MFLGRESADCLFSRLLFVGGAAVVDCDVVDFVVLDSLAGFYPLCLFFLNTLLEEVKFVVLLLLLVLRLAVGMFAFGFVFVLPRILIFPASDEDLAVLGAMGGIWAVFGATAVAIGFGLPLEGRLRLLVSLLGMLLFR